MYLYDITLIAWGSIPFYRTLRENGSLPRRFQHLLVLRLRQEERRRLSIKGSLIGSSAIKIKQENFESERK